MTNCKHKIPVGGTIVSFSKQPSYECGFCEMERLQRVEAAAKTLVTDLSNDSHPWLSSEVVRHLKSVIENKPQEPRAAVSYIEENKKILVVWNKRYGGWSLPGGKVEDGETPKSAQERELREETSLKTISASLMYEGPTAIEGPEGRGRHVMVYRVRSHGDERETEPGCPVTWMTREELLKWSPFKVFYEKMFVAIDKDVHVGVPC